MRMFALLFALACALSVGCDTAPSNNSTDAGDVHQPDVTQDTADVFEATLVAIAPGNIPGDFLVNGDLICEQATVCEWVASSPAEFHVEFACEQVIALPVTTNVTDPDNGGQVSVGWTEPGSWGLAPEGEYRYDGQNGESFHDVFTRVRDGEIQLILDFGVTAVIVTGNTFFVDTSLYTIEGTISQDLKTIEFTRTWKSDGQQVSPVYHLVE